MNQGAIPEGDGDLGGGRDDTIEAHGDITAEMKPSTGITGICDTFQPHKWKNYICRNCLYSRLAHELKKAPTLPNASSSSEVKVRASAEESDRLLKPKIEQRNQRTGQRRTTVLGSESLNAAFLRPIQVHGITDDAEFHNRTMDEITDMKEKEFTEPRVKMKELQHLSPGEISREEASKEMILAKRKIDLLEKEKRERDQVILQLRIKCESRKKKLVAARSQPVSHGQSIIPFNLDQLGVGSAEKKLEER